MGRRQDTSCITSQVPTGPKKARSGDGRNEACFATSGVMSTNGWHAATNPRRAFDRILLSCRRRHRLAQRRAGGPRPITPAGGEGLEVLGSDASGDVCPMWRALRTRSGGCSKGDMDDMMIQDAVRRGARCCLVAGLADAMDGDEPTMPGPRRVVLTAVPSSTWRRCVVRGACGRGSIFDQMADWRVNVRFGTPVSIGAQTGYADQTDGT